MRRQIMIIVIAVLLGLIAGFTLAQYGSTQMALDFMNKLPGCW